MKQIVVGADGTQSERTMTPEEEAAFEASRPVPMTDDQIYDLQIAALRHVDRQIFRAMFAIVNDLRTLQSQPTLTLPQFRAWVKGL